MDVVWAPWRMELIEKGGSGGEGCIFCDFPKADDDAAHLIVHRGEVGFVILNRFPYNNGHVMVVPYAHVGAPDGLSAEDWGGLAVLLRRTVGVVGDAFGAHGLNVGMNLGRCAGAGIPGHLHWHVVPRWDGDTNFMPVLAETKVMPEHLDNTWHKLKDAFGRQS
jgi:ATP adenylyltransferase